MTHPDTERELSNVVCEQATVIQFSILHKKNVHSVYHQLLLESAARRAQAVQEI